MGRLADIFGIEFETKYFEALQRASKVGEETAKQLAKQGLELMKKMKIYNVEVADARGKVFNVLLATVPNNPEVKKTSAGNYKLGLICPAISGVTGAWISAFFAEREEAEKVARQQGETILLVGKLREREFAGGTTFSINVAKAFSLDEVEALLHE